MSLLSRIWSDEDGQDVVEYALIAALVSVVAYLAVQGTGVSVNTLWSSVSSNVQIAT